MHRHYDPQASHHRHGADHSGPRSRLAMWLSPAAVAAVVYIATGFYSVRPNEIAVVRRCGKALAGTREPGLHFGFPWGIDRVTRVKVRESKRVGVGVGLLDRAQGRTVDPQQVERLTGDRNLVVISAVVQYQVADARAFLFATDNVPTLVENTAAAALSAAVSTMNVDDVLTVQRMAIQHQVRRESQEMLDRYGAGVRVTSVSLEEVRAPDDVADAFRDVTSAREDRQRTINEAQGYANQLIPEARGRAAQEEMQAEALASQLTQAAEGDAAHFKALVAELDGHRHLTAQRLTLETIERILPGMKKILLDGRAGENLDLGLIEETPIEEAP